MITILHVLLSTFTIFHVHCYPLLWYYPQLTTITHDYYSNIYCKIHHFKVHVLPLAASGSHFWPTEELQTDIKQYVAIKLLL